MRDKGKVLAVVNTGKRTESVVSESASQKVTNDSFSGVSSTIDLSAYLQKSIWEKAFEIKTDANGVVYLFGKIPVVTQYGIAMFSGEGGDIEVASIYDGLPIDEETLYWDALYDDEGNVVGKVLKAQGGAPGGGGIADSVSWNNVTGKPLWLLDNKISYSEIDGAPDLSIYALKTAIPSLSGYATEQWVNSKGYATTSDLNARVNELVNGAPDAYDTLKEIANVLEGNVNSIGDIITTLKTKWTQDNVKINSWDTAFSWGNHSNAGYAKKSYVDSTFVTLGSDENVNGVKNFVDGLKIGGVEFKYDSTNNAIYIQKEDNAVVNFYTMGGVTMHSQRSLKNIVDERGLSLKELSAIKPIRYTWKDGRDKRIHMGGIADDVQQVLPEVIYKAIDGTLTMDYGNAGFAVAASLINPVVDHDERIKALEAENKELKERLKRLEELVWQ